MQPVYVDTSCLVSIALGEKGHKSLVKSLATCDLYSSNLLEAELAATLKREGLQPNLGQLLSGLRWVFVDRALSAEIQQVLNVGFVRGADLWHLSTALFLKSHLPKLSFSSLDKRQIEVAGGLNLKLL